MGVGRGEKQHRWRATGACPGNPFTGRRVARHLRRSRPASWRRSPCPGENASRSRADSGSSIGPATVRMSLVKPPRGGLRTPSMRKPTSLPDLTAP